MGGLLHPFKIKVPLLAEEGHNLLDLWPTRLYIVVISDIRMEEDISYLGIVLDGLTLSREDRIQVPVFPNQLECGLWANPEKANVVVGTTHDTDFHQLLPVDAKSGQLVQEGV